MAYVAAADVPAGSAAPSKAAILALVRDAYSIKSVADATARAQAVTDWPTLTGAAIGVDNPVIVYRQDLHRVEVSVTGAAGSFYPLGGACGSEVIDTDANGEDTVLHGLGYTPTNVQVTVQRTGSGSDTVASLAKVVVWAVSSTTITFRVYRTDTNAVFAGNAIGIFWRAE